MRDWRRVSEHANEPFSTSHFQILKLLKGEGENSGLKKFHSRFKPYLPREYGSHIPASSLLCFSFRQNRSLETAFKDLPARWSLYTEHAGT